MVEANRSQPRGSEQAPQLRVVAAEPSLSPNGTGLADAGNEAGFCSAWLSSQCTRISGIIAGLLIVPPPASGLSATSTSWPERTPYLGDLSRLAERASLERRPVVSPGRIGSETSMQPVGVFIALPLGSGSQPMAVAAVALASGSPAALAPERVAEQLRWGAGWLEALPWARRYKDVSTDLARAASTLDFLAAIGEQPRLRGIPIAIANDLAARLRCDRVSVGVVKRNGSVRLRAISHSTSFKGQGRLVNAIENAMEEAIDQRLSVAYPPLPSTERAVTMAHRTLTEIIRTPGTSLISVVIADNQGEPVGALTLERYRNGSFVKEELQLVQAIAALLGPIVGLHLRANRLLSGRIIDWVNDGLISLFGPRRPGLKLGVIGVISLALFLAVAKGEYRVTAKSVLEGEVQRAAVAPFDGIVRAAPVRAGDTVRGGDLLAALEDRDLILERLKWRAERDKFLQKQREVRANHDRTNLVILDSQIREAEAQLALSEEKLSRARILAPFDGIVVSGDLSQMLGSPVETGKLLFEIAPLNSYRLIIHVDERDVRYVATGQGGTVTFAGTPWTPLRIILNRITPVTIAEDGRNSFRIEARLTELSPHLRPGMEGVAKIETGRRSIVWIWMHTVIEWMRLTAWKYLP